jgi:hypothetical protein
MVNWLTRETGFSGTCQVSREAVPILEPVGRACMVLTKAAQRGADGYGDGE